LEILRYLPEIVALTILALLSFYDIKTRNIPNKVAYTGLVLVLILRVVTYYKYGHPLFGYLKFYILFSGILVAVLALTAITGVMGWGDVFSFIIVMVAQPLPSLSVKLLPPLLVTVMLFSISIILLFIVQLTYNLLFNFRHIVDLGYARYRIIYPLIGKPMKIRNILVSKWWYPLNLCNKYSIRFNIYMDPPDVHRLVRDAIKRGCHNENDYVWVTYGVPGVAIIALSYLLTLIIGDSLIINLIK